MAMAPLPHVLRDYALLADGERGAVIAPTGELAWMCFPRWDSDPVFASLLGGKGHYIIRPSGSFVWGGQYDTGTLVWRNRWLVGSDTVECIEALAFPGRVASAVLLRRVVAVRGAAQVDVELCLADAFGRGGTTKLRRTGEHVWEGRRHDLRVRWLTPAEPRWDDGVAKLRVDVPPETHVDFVLELSTDELSDEPSTGGEVLQATTTAWRRTVSDVPHSLAPRDARHAVAVLRGLTASSGAMVAAATTSLPERADEGRNYDNRYAWLRDQCYAGMGAAAAGVPDLVDTAVRFVHERLLEDGPKTRPAYRVDGTAVPAERNIDLPGYPGAPHVVAGNHAGSQFQLDVFGEALLLFASASDVDRMHPDAWRAAEVAAAAIETEWTRPDAGIWELAPAEYAHSRLICAAGLFELARCAPAGTQSNRWLALADKIVAGVAANSVHPSGRWQRAPDDPRCDASLLLPSLRGSIPADDPRTHATLDAVRTDLCDEGYVYRYRAGDEPLGQAEGAFLLCGFWLALALHQAGDRLHATRLFDRNRAACGPSGLFTEEFDVHQRQLRGNVPQAFVHALLLEASARLTEDD
jgi:hypothetical protein